VVCGVLALGGVIAFHFPQLLTAPDFRARYSVPMLRGLLQLVLGSAFLLGGLSAVLRKRKVLAIVGISLATTATLLGGASVPLPERVETSVGLGLDWFLLNLLVVAAIFVPLERALPRDPAQPVFRPGWTTDGAHFMVSHLLVQLFSFASLGPATALRDHWIPAGLVAWTSALPLPVQLAGVVLLTDLSQYWVHRAFHQVPILWRLHAVHHSSETMDWLAGSRLHLLDALITRALALAPALLLGFSPAALATYLAFVSFHAVFIHANFGARLGWLEPFLVTPRIHHFHHAREREAVDVNFAVHLPFLDRLFGTRFLPADRWPRAYGIEGPRVAEGWWGQLVGAFRTRR
jgi:lathosterol oxidase